MQDNYNVSRETFMTYKSEIGKIGEGLACDYLLSKGYKVIGRNLRQKWGELDIISKDPANVLVFVEVKTMRQNNPAISSDQDIGVAGLLPEDNLTAAKLKKLQRTAQMFAGKHSDLINEERGWRIDLIAITLFDDKQPKINHYENI